MSNEVVVKAEISNHSRTPAVDLRFAYSPTALHKVKQVPGRRFIPHDSPGGPCWRVPRDLETMRTCRRLFGEKLWLGDNLSAWGREEVRREKRIGSIATANDAELEVLPDSLVKGWKGNGLYPYQKADIKFMSEANVINANQPGSGKTVETIAALIEAGMAYGKHLVVAPVTSLETVWVSEIESVYKAAGLQFPAILTGSSPEERKRAIFEAADMDSGFWLVINPHMIRMKRVSLPDGRDTYHLNYEELERINWDSMTIDEFHLMGLSNGSTLGAKGVHRIAEVTQPKKRFALSGTPMGGKPIKLFGALKFLDPARFTSKWNWARAWLEVTDNGFGKQIEGVPSYREEAFNEHLKPYLIRRTKREALPGIPPKQKIDVWCKMTKKQDKQYKQFAAEAELKIQEAEESGRLSATNILAEYTRLKQFASAYCDIKLNGGDPIVKPTAKSGKLEQLIERLLEEGVLEAEGEERRTALVFSQFNGMVEMVSETLRAKGVEVGVITGATKGEDRKTLVQAFQEQGSGSPQVLVMNIMAGGTALTLSRADSVHILDETWVPDNQEQAEDRAHRADALTMARDEVRIYYYRTRDSVEEHIQQVVFDKSLSNQKVLDLRRMVAQGASDVG